MIMNETFKREVFYWAEELNVKPKEIHIRKMRRKWASCSSNGRLTFSIELLHKSKDKRSKVIVHELLHLRYPNHGKMFDSLLRAHLGKKGIAYNLVI
ncbi:MAG TPA: M48 family metallopeptidase [Acidobacteriota bacterium]|nr:M48 family metallopeptidase [Acidobacteriota bacterium]